MKNARQIAFEALYKIFYDDAYSNIVLDNALENAESGKAFATRLVYGVVERKLTLDYIIKKYCDKVKPKINVILRMGVYQLYFMDKVPSSAAINESIELSKNNGLGFYSKFINAVLHKIDDERINIDGVDDLSIRYSIPKHLIAMWNKAYGEKAVNGFLGDINEGAGVFAIPNSLYVDADELLYELNCEGIDGEITDGAVMITSSFDLGKSQAFENGLFHIEDISCYKAVKALGIHENDTVIDICSAPGGKAFTAAELMNNHGIVYAYDLYPQRAALIEAGASRLNLTSIKSGVNNALIYNGNICTADKIICDVPCSGFGIIRRKPEIRYKDLDSIKDLPGIQLQILETSSKYLKKGGRLLYSTCTLNKRENEKVVERFIAGNDGFAVLESETFFPLKNSGDGFFYSVIERK